jgi:hypothetical protein
MERLSTETSFKGIVLNSHFRIIGEQMTKCTASSLKAQCYMGVIDVVDLEGGSYPEDVETTVVYFCDPSQRQKCGDLIVEAAVKLENTRK